jgi:hypothetical protein
MISGIGFIFGFCSRLTCNHATGPGRGAPQIRLEMGHPARGLPPGLLDRRQTNRQARFLPVRGGTMHHAGFGGFIEGRTYLQKGRGRISLFARGHQLEVVPLQAVKVRLYATVLQTLAAAVAHAALG